MGYTGEYLVRSLDDLTYRYDGNRLLSVEAADNDQYVNTFEDEVHEAEECSYDLNGNLIKDNNRNLQNIDYNYLNLPQRICYGKQDAGKVISYTYATDGTKLKSLYATGTNDILSPIGTLDSNMDNDIVYSDSVVYCDNSLYVKGRLDRILLPDGYIQATYRTVRGRLVAFYEYYYLMKDHQGSARINISEEYLDDRPSEGSQKAVSYYPFGKAMTGWTKWVNPFKEPYTYTGKKEETMHGLGWYDYGKRFYDPNYRLSFISIDPLCEKYYSISPYAYCANNPIKFVDPTGMAWRPTYDEDHDGNLICNGYEWVDEGESYNEDGTLKNGLYAQAIFFSDNGTFDPLNDYNIGSSTATVYLADGTTTTFEANTNPSDPNIFATVPEGTYHATVGIHNGSKSRYTALKLRDEGATSQTIELNAPNPAHLDRTYAEGINIHKPGIGNLTGFTRKKTPISQGCLLIDINDWSRFIGIFDTDSQRSNIISTTVSRSMVIPANVTRLPAFNFILNGTRRSFFSPFKF